MTTTASATETRGIYDGFEGYRTPTDDDYRLLLTQGLVVLDTNVLLNLYRYNAQTRTDLVAVLNRLEDRLWVPHQVLVEFWRNRESALRDLQETGDNTVEALGDHLQQSINVLRTWANRVALSAERRVELQEHLDLAFNTVTEAIKGFVAEEALGQALNTNNDPVIQALEPVLKGRVGSPMTAKARTEAIEEALRRIGAGIPPGFKDKNKTDELAAGDYLVWRQLLDEAGHRKHDVLLVTGDVKDDWWRRDRGQSRGPRPELVEELRHHVGVRLFMLRPESLLLHARDVLRVDVQEESVQDVERVDRVLFLTGWTQEAVQELLARLDLQAPVQAMAIRFAAEHNGFVSRENVYEIGRYNEGRMLRGFTRPANRIAQELRDEGIAGEGTLDVLKAVYDPAFSYVQASGFEIPHDLVPLVRDLSDLDS
ncbi:PIN domain-containing protein [Micromonospora sp. NPDC005305]|uniref:PIN-like domain-containing protein n=1 Tax=Micromonospora sp. NPDC005305 TaxID=3156875 RepID=UPI0033B81E12